MVPQENESLKQSEDVRKANEGLMKKLTESLDSFTGARQTAAAAAARGSKRHFEK